MINKISLVAITAATLAATVQAADPTFSGSFTSWASEGTYAVSEYNEMSFFSALTVPEGVALSDGAPSTAYNKAIKDANNPKLTSLLALGGWGGSRYFSSLVKPDKQDAFAKQVAKIVKDNKFKGIEIDWTFPGSRAANENDITWDKGNFCNEVDASDYDNLVAWKKKVRTEIKQSIGEEPTITASVPMNGFNGSDGQKLSDASGLVADGACDYISIMVHDVAGNYQPDTGINAPLDDGSAPETQKYSIKKAIDYWVNTAKVPAEKVQIILPAYAKIFRTKSNTLNANAKAYNQKTMPKLSQSDSQNAGSVQADVSDKQGEDGCDIWRDYGATYTYSGLFSNGTILDKGDAKGEKTVGEWTYNWDDTTASPFLFDAGRQLFITYDNPASMKAKAKWAKDQGLRGIKLYPVTGDQDGQLIKAIKEGWAS